MHRSLIHEGTRRGKIAGKRGRTVACSGSRPDRSIMSRAILLRVATESTRNRAYRNIGRCSSAVRLAVRKEENLAGRHARPPSKPLMCQRNKANIHSTANAGLERSCAQLGGGDGVTRGARSGRQSGSQQRGYDSYIVCHA
jgi:hypothetical protein